MTDLASEKTETTARPTSTLAAGSAPPEAFPPPPTAHLPIEAHALKAGESTGRANGWAGEKSMRDLSRKQRAIPDRSRGRAHTLMRATALKVFTCISRHSVTPGAVIGRSIIRHAARNDARGNTRGYSAGCVRFPAVPGRTRLMSSALQRPADGFRCDIFPAWDFVGDPRVRAAGHSCGRASLRRPSSPPGFAIGAW